MRTLPKGALHHKSMGSQTSGWELVVKNAHSGVFGTPEEKWFQSTGWCSTAWGWVPPGNLEKGLYLIASKAIERILVSGPALWKNWPSSWFIRNHVIHYRPRDRSPFVSRAFIGATQIRESLSRDLQGPIMPWRPKCENIFQICHRSSPEIKSP